MKKILILILFVITTLNIFANDGSFFGRSGHIYPVVDRDVEIRKEKITFTLDTNDYYLPYFRAKVQFEFYNNGPAKNIKMGFVSPSGLQKFEARVNGKEIGDDDIEFQHSGDSIVKSINYESIMLFNCYFKKGINYVEHEIGYRGSDHVSGNISTEYILTTIKYWANSEVKDFELIIEPVDDFFFFVPYSFENGDTNNYWETEGAARMEKMKDFTKPGYLMTFYIKHGRAVFKKKNFNPDKDLFIEFFYTNGVTLAKNFFNPTHYFGLKYPSEKFKKYKKEDIYYLQIEYELPNNKLAGLIKILQDCLGCWFKRAIECLNGEIEDSPPFDMTKENFSLIKNFIFAFEGFRFRDKETQAYFEQFAWYFPEKESTDDPKALSENSREVYYLLDNLEKKLLTKK